MKYGKYILVVIFSLMTFNVFGADQHPVLPHRPSNMSLNSQNGELQCSCCPALTFLKAWVYTCCFSDDQPRCCHKSAVTYRPATVKKEGRDALSIPLNVSRLSTASFNNFVIAHQPSDAQSIEGPDQSVRQNHYEND